jgi:hypothetical protein
LIGFSRDDEEVERGLEWFITNQNDDGLWPTGYGKGKKAETMREWVGLAVCRMMKRFYD